MNELNVTPLLDRVIVKQDAAEDKTQGGIIIPDTVKEKPNRGLVLVTGKGKKLEEVTDALNSEEFYGLMQMYRNSADATAFNNVKEFIHKIFMITVKPEDKVLYGKHAGMPIEIESVQYLIMREGDILAVI